MNQKMLTPNAGGGGGATSADKVTYDNSISGLGASDVQGAIDEVANCLIYSSDEEIIGKTKDGKNVCRRIFEWEVPTLTTHGYTWLDWDFSDYINLLDIAGMLTYKWNADSSPEKTIIPMTHASDYAKWCLGISDISATGLYLQHGTGWSLANYRKVTLMATYIKGDTP